MSRLFLIAIISIALVSCEKYDMEITEGNFSGTFSVTYSEGRKSGSVTLELKDGRYKSTGNPDRIPAGGSGVYAISDGKITFTDENGWTADFDWGLILSGDYNYKFNGKRLKFSRTSSFAKYEYTLKKQ